MQNKNVIKIQMFLLLCCLNITYGSAVDYKEIEIIKQQALLSANKYLSDAKEYVAHGEKLIQNTNIDKKGFLKQQQELLAKSYEQDSRSKNYNSNQIIVFVSFSMPEQALKELLIESDKYNASLVIQGLVDNSLPKTLIKISQLVTKVGNKGGLQVDPNLFEQYKITKVPAYVINEHKVNNNFHVVYGLSSIKQAVDAFVSARVITSGSAMEILTHA